MPEMRSHCLLCGRSRLKKDDFAVATLNLAPEHSVSQCCHCGFRFLNPRPTIQEYEQLYSEFGGPLAEKYPVPQDFYSGNQMRRLREYQDKLNILSEHVTNGRILEIGACTGLFLDTAHNRGFEVEGIEPSEKNCRIALEKFSLKLRQGSVEDFDFPAESFDVVFSSHVFEHLSDPLAVAKRVSFWLKPGGLHMMEVPNEFGTLPKRRSRLLGRIKRRGRSARSIHHTVFFSPASLRLLSRLSGCHTIHIRNVYYSKRNVFTPRVLLGKVIDRLGFGSRHLELLAQKPT